jgi:hypothetical protein
MDLEQTAREVLSRPPAVPVSGLVGKVISLLGMGVHAQTRAVGKVKRVTGTTVFVEVPELFEDVRFDRVTGWPMDDDHKVNGFRLDYAELAFLREESKRGIGRVEEDGLTTTPGQSPVAQGQAKTMSNTVTLEGYGDKTGNAVEAVVVKKDGNLAVLEVKDGNGKGVQTKYKLVDGHAVGAKPGGSGFRITGESLATLTGKKPTTNGKKPSTKEPRVSTKAPPKVAASVTDTSGMCLCGCDQPVKKGSRFLQGHDAKFHSMVKKGLRGQVPKKELNKNVLREVEHLGGYGSQEKVADRAEEKPDETPKAEAKSNGAKPAAKGGAKTPAKSGSKK